MSGRWIPLALAALVAGCAELPDEGVCGNRLIEPALGEACDDGADSALCTASCELKCVSGVPAGYTEVDAVDVDGDGIDEQVSCPVGSACGWDLLCRRPSGLFATASEGFQFAFDAQQLGLADTNADGLTDLIGLSATTIRIRYGDPDQPLELDYAESSPIVGGQVALVDVPTDDGVVERALHVPSVGGVVEYRFADGVPVPEITLAFAIPNGSELPDEGRDLQRLRGVLRGDPAAFASLTVLVPTAGDLVAYDITPTGPQVRATCAAGVSGNIAIYGTEVTTAPGEWHDFAVPVTTTGPTRICLFHPQDAWSVDMITLNPALIGRLAPLASVAYAHIGPGDSCPDLLFTVLDPATESVAQTYYQPLSSLVPGAPCTPNGPPRFLSMVSGIVLATGRAGDAPRDQLVTSAGLYSFDSSGASSVAYSAPRTWGSAAIADVDGDGRGEVVAVSFARDDVDVVRFSPVTGAASAYRVDTSRPAQHLVTGDLDGDFVTDVAVVEEAEVGHGISVLYATAGGVLGDPILMADFDGKLGVIRASRRGGNALDLDGIDDLAIVVAPTLLPSDPYPAELAAGFLYGGPSRRLVSPQWPPAALDPPNNPPDAEVRGLITLPADPVDRLALFADRKADANPAVAPVLAGPPACADSTTASTLWWEWAWDATAGSYYSPQGAYNACTEIGGGPRLAGGTFAGTEVAVVADSGPTGGFHAIGPGCQTAGLIYGVNGFGNGRPRELAFHDLVAAHAGLELLAGFERVGAERGAELVIATASAPAGGSCPLPDTLVLDVGEAVIQAGFARHECTSGAILPIVLDDNTTGERLVAGCTSATPIESDRAGLFLVDTNAITDTTTVAPGGITELVRTIGEVQRVVVGDVDGDGLDDLIAQVAVGGQLQIEVFTQCAAHDVSRCTGGAISTGSR